MTAKVEPECDKGNGVGECEQSRVAKGEAERTPSWQFVVLLGIDLLLHLMDVNAPHAPAQAI